MIMADHRRSAAAMGAVRGNQHGRIDLEPPRRVLRDIRRRPNFGNMIALPQQQAANLPVR